MCFSLEQAGWPLGSPPSVTLRMYLVDHLQQRFSLLPSALTSTAAYEGLSSIVLFSESDIARYTASEYGGPI